MTPERFEPNWGRMLSAPEWEEEWRPWLQQALDDTHRQLETVEDATQIVHLQERARLLRGWIEAPEANLEMERAQIAHMIGAGREDVEALDARRTHRIWQRWFGRRDAA